MRAASVPICRPLAATDAAFRLQGCQRTGFMVSLVREARTGLSLTFYRGERRIGLATLRRFLDRAVNLAKTPVEVRHDPDLYVQPGIYIGALGEGSDLAGDGLSDVGLGEEAVSADGVERHQDAPAKAAVMSKMSRS
jgi:hypothetical protein